MRHRSALRALALLIAVVLAAPWVHAQTLKLRLIGTTDLHMQLLSWDYCQDRAVVEYGFARTATLIDAARAEASNSLLVDNGEIFQGSPLGDMVAGAKPLATGHVHPAIALLNRFGYDAAALGNHEFNCGLDFLRLTRAGARSPVLAVNVVEAAGPRRGQPAFQPHPLLERRVVDDSGAPHTLKIGVVGVVPPQVMLWDRQHPAGQVEALDILDTVRRAVLRLRADGADVVVVLAHSGYGSGAPAPMSEYVTAAIARVPGLDAIVFGHSHGEFPGPTIARSPGADVTRGNIHGVPAAMPGFWGSQRAAVAETVRADHEATLAWVRAEVARTADPIHSFFAQVADDPSVQLVSQAQLAHARRLLAGTPHDRLPLLSAAAPFKSSDPAGPPEQALLNLGSPSYSFDTIDGLRYRIDVTQPARYDRSGRLVAHEARGIAHRAAVPQVSLLRDWGNGFATYEAAP